MKMTAVKKLSAVLLCFIMMFVMGTNVFAETVQDRLEQSSAPRVESIHQKIPFILILTFLDGLPA